MKRTWLFLILAAVFVGLNSCASTRMIMQNAPSKPKADIASPALSIGGKTEWEAEQRSQIKSALETHVYGRLPGPGAPSRVSRDLVTVSGFNDSAWITEYVMTVSPNGVESPQMPYVLLSPKHTTEPIPLIIMENFCPNHAVIPIEGLTKPSGNYFDCSMDGMMGSVFGYVFGRYITTPPIEDIMKRGYALAIVYPPEFIPDSPGAGLAALKKYAQNDDDTSRWGAIGAWAWQFSRIVDQVEANPQFSKIITYGHSRYGKSALVAAAFDARIDAVIAHQSGTGGASLSRNKPGESIAAITESYPHWFTPQYAQYGADQSGLPIDQHHLLALIAPRPILLGNARRDVWSDPEGAFRAAQGANPAYEIYGSKGLTAQRLTQFKPEDDIAFWMRPGTHGVVKEDWPAFLDFLDAHFK